MQYTLVSHSIMSNSNMDGYLCQLVTNAMLLQVSAAVAGEFALFG